MNDARAADNWYTLLMRKDQIDLNTYTRTIAVLALIPIIPWILIQPLGVRFGDATQALVSLGQMTALVGTVLFALGIIMHSKIFSKNIWRQTPESLKKVLSAMEIVSFLLLASHPIILAVKLAPVSLLETMRFFVPGSDWAFNFGIYALLLLIALYVIRFCAGGGEKLKASPQVLAAVLFLGTLHAFFIPSSLSESLVLKSYVLSLVGLALVVNAVSYFLYKKERGVTSHIEKSPKHLIN